MAKFLFFNTNIIGFLRFALPVCHHLEAVSPGNQYSFIYDEHDPELYQKLVDLAPAGSKIMFAGAPTFENIQQNLALCQPDILLVFAQRINDSAYVSAAKNLGIKTALFQHGIYIPFMKREASLFIEKFQKTLRYIRYSLAIATAAKANRWQYLAAYIRMILWGENVHNTTIDREKVNVDRVLVYGEYWKHYHQEHYGYDYEAHYTVGCPDLAGIERILAQPQEKAICYMAQSLVEDGRLKRETMLEFISQLSDAAKDVKLYVKLHPRSDLSLYETLKEVNFAEFCRDFIPHCSHYIGHYSTLLALALTMTDNVLLWDFVGHEIPDYFKASAKVTTSDTMKLSNFIHDQNSDLEASSSDPSFEYYFYYGGVDPMLQAAKQLLSL